MVDSEHRQDLHQRSSQQCEVVSFRGCDGPHMLLIRECGRAPDSADTARTSGSWANRPDLATRCFGRRAEKKENSTNRRHPWNAGVGSNEVERKRGTNFDREPGTGEREPATRWWSDAMTVAVWNSARPQPPSKKYPEINVVTGDLHFVSQRQAGTAGVAEKATIRDSRQGRGSNSAQLCRCAAATAHTCYLSENARKCDQHFHLNRSRGVLQHTPVQENSSTHHHRSRGELHNLKQTRTRLHFTLVIFTFLHNEVPALQESPSTPQECRLGVWRLQQREVVSFRGCGEHMLPFCECENASGSADAARTSGP